MEKVIFFFILVNFIKQLIKLTNEVLLYIKYIQFLPCIYCRI